jgi:hypothetical protein
LRSRYRRGSEATGEVVRNTRNEVLQSELSRLSD